MAEIKGIYPVPEIEVAPCGLLSVARVIRHETSGPSDVAWARPYEYNGAATGTVTIRNFYNQAVTGGVVYDGSAAADWYPVEPFFIQVDKSLSGLDLLATDPFEEIEDQLEAVAQKALEYELWEGVAIQAGSSETLFLRIAVADGGATILNPTPGTGVTPDKALALIEQGIAGSPFGARGVIHMTRDVASVLGSKLLYKPDHGGKSDKAYTRTGTRVVIGSGYTGNGPLGATGTAASVTNKWMFATGSIEGHLGDPGFVGDLADGLDPTVNDATVAVLRSAAVHFDPSIFLAAQVTLP